MQRAGSRLLASSCLAHTQAPGAYPIIGVHALTLVADHRVLRLEVTIVATCSWGAHRYHEECWISSPRGSGQTRAKAIARARASSTRSHSSSYALMPANVGIYLYAPLFQPFATGAPLGSGVVVWLKQSGRGVIVNAWMCPIWRRLPRCLPLKMTRA